MTKETKQLEDYSIQEIDDKTRELGSVKKAADYYGVPVAEMYQFRSKHSKMLKKLKADRENGMIIEEVPVVKTQPVSSKDKEALETLQKEHDQLKDEHQKLDIALAATKDEVVSYRRKASQLADENKQHEETIESLSEQLKDLNEQVVSLQEEKKELEDLVKDREDKALKMKEMTDSKHKIQLQHQQEKIDGQLKALDAAGKSVEQMRESLKVERLKNAELQDALKQSEESFQKAVSEYEEINKSQQESISRLSQINDALEERVKSYEDQLIDMSALSTTETGDNSAITQEEAIFYKHHALKYFSELNNGGQTA